MYTFFSECIKYLQIGVLTILGQNVYFFGEKICFKKVEKRPLNQPNNNTKLKPKLNKTFISLGIF